MPFRVEDPADEIDYVRSERARIAQRIVSRLAYSPGDAVQITGDLAEGIALVEPAGIVTGYIPAHGGQVSVIVSWADGQERELVLPATSITKETPNV